MYAPAIHETCIQIVGKYMFQEEFLHSKFNRKQMALALRKGLVLLFEENKKFFFLKINELDPEFDIKTCQFFGVSSERY